MRCAFHKSHHLRRLSGVLSQLGMAFTKNLTKRGIDIRVFVMSNPCPLNYQSLRQATFLEQHKFQDVQFVFFLSRRRDFSVVSSPLPSLLTCALATISL